MKKKKEIWTAAGLLASCAVIWGCTQQAVNKEEKEIKVGVAVYNQEDAYITNICGYLEDEIFQYERENPNIKIRKKIADAHGSQQEQNNQIDQFIALEYDILLVNIVDRTNAAVLIDKAAEAEIPIVFFNREPVREDIFRSENVYYEGSDAKQSAILQAEVIADALQKEPDKLDRNQDGILQYAMLEGESGHQDTLIRSEWVMKGLEEKGVQTCQVASAVGNWEKSQAEVIVSQWILEYGDELELIISNNDDMALGAWEALKEHDEKEIQIVGIDGVEEVCQLVEEGEILGSVLCDTRLHAKALVEFIDALEVKEENLEKLGLEDERYYMIPLTKVEK